LAFTGELCAKRWSMPCRRSTTTPNAPNRSWAGAVAAFITGDLRWAGCLDVFAAAPRTLITELFAAGFRWSGRPKLADRGLWHPELQIGIDVIDHVQRGLVQPTNTLTVALTSASQRLRIGTLSR
jgi:hypothetical protein